MMWLWRKFRDEPEKVVSKPETQRVRAADVKPYQWAIWCSIEGGTPFANEIVCVRPSDDGAYLWFMLDSFNFDKFHPDDMLDLIPTKKGTVPT